MEDRMVKLLIKVSDADNIGKWTHLCYVPEQLIETYKTEKPEYYSNLNDTLARWAEQDFGKKRCVLTALELEELKNDVKALYKETYPDVYLDQSTDRQGWLRVWVTRHMKEDLENGK